MSDRFDLEQAITSVWMTTEDLKSLHWCLLDNPDGPMSEDQLSNMILAIENILELRMTVLWDTFCKTYEIDGYRKMKEEVQ
jgi:hypothetical protein